MVKGKQLVGGPVIIIHCIKGELTKVKSFCLHATGEKKKGQCAIFFQKSTSTYLIVTRLALKLRDFVEELLLLFYYGERAEFRDILQGSR